MARLTDKQRKRIITEYVEGDGKVSQRALAKKYQVSQKTISTILKDKKVRQKVSDKKNENTEDMITYLEGRKSTAMGLIDKLLGAMSTSIEKAPLKEQAGALKILSEVFGRTSGNNDTKHDDTVTQIIVQAEDASGGTCTEGDDATGN